MTKRCSKCLVEKALEGFYRKAGGKHGRHSVCKVCRNAYNKRRYEHNTYEISLVQKRYYKANQERRQAYQRAYWNKTKLAARLTEADGIDNINHINQQTKE